MSALKGTGGSSSTSSIYKWGKKWDSVIKRRWRLSFTMQQASNNPHYEWLPLFTTEHRVKASVVERLYIQNESWNLDKIRRSSHFWSTETQKLILSSYILHCRKTTEGKTIWSFKSVSFKFKIATHRLNFHWNCLLENCQWRLIFHFLPHFPFVANTSSIGLAKCIVGWSSLEEDFQSEHSNLLAEWSWTN